MWKTPNANESRTKTLAKLCFDSCTNYLAIRGLQCNATPSPPSNKHIEKTNKNPIVDPSKTTVNLFYIFLCSAAAPTNKANATYRRSLLERRFYIRQKIDVTICSKGRCRSLLYAILAIIMKMTKCILKSRAGLIIVNSKLLKARRSKLLCTLNSSYFQNEEKY